MRSNYITYQNDIAYPFENRVIYNVITNLNDSCQTFILYIQIIFFI